MPQSFHFGEEFYLWFGTIFAGTGHPHSLKAVPHLHVCRALINPLTLWFILSRPCSGIDLEPAVCRMMISSNRGGWLWCQLCVLHSQDHALVWIIHFCSLKITCLELDTLWTIAITALLAVQDQPLKAACSSRNQGLACCCKDGEGQEGLCEYSWTRWNAACPYRYWARICCEINLQLPRG